MSQKPLLSKLRQDLCPPRRPKMEGHPCEDIWAQQETPTCHLSPSNWPSLVTVAGHSVAVHHLPLCPPHGTTSAKLQGQRCLRPAESLQMGCHIPASLQTVPSSTRPGPTVLLGRSPFASSSSSLHPGEHIPPACEPSLPKCRGFLPSPSEPLPVRLGKGTITLHGHCGFPPKQRAVFSRKGILCSHDAASRFHDYKHSFTSHVTVSLC